MKITPSLVMLTWNRKDSVEQSLRANIKSAGYPIHEIVHVDNGSQAGFTNWFKNEFRPSVQILHDHNTGVATGYNRGFALASGSHVMLTGCDRIMPEGWLAQWVEALEKVPETAVISCYTYEEPGRYHKEHEVVFPPEIRNGIYLQRAIPVEARIHSKDFLFKTGFWRQCFDPYGYEDSEWSDRANLTARTYGLINYILPNMGYAEHLPDTDFGSTVEGVAYKQYKDKIHADVRRRNLFKWCWENKSPYYNPFYRNEPNLLEEMKNEPC